MSHGANPTTASAASKLLGNLPSRGFMSSAAPSSNPNMQGGMRVYICDHDALPPEDQVIKTDQMNILIRALTLKKHNKGDAKAASSTEGSRKRTSERTLDGRASAKRLKTDSQSNAQQEGPNGCTLDKDYQGLNVERLRALLKEKGLSPKGNKDELIARLRSASK